LTISWHVTAMLQQHKFMSGCLALSIMIFRVK